LETADRLKEAVRRRDEAKQSKSDIEKELKSIFEQVKNDKIAEEKFIEKMKKFIAF